MSTIRSPRPSPARAIASLPLVLILPILQLLVPASALAAWPEEDSGSFDGFWAMSGTVHIIELDDRELAAAGGLTGAVTIQTSQGPVPSFETDCVVFADAGSGGMGYCIWTATSGDQVLVRLQSEGPPGTGLVRGEFTGGTGRFESLSGRFRFEWTFSIDGGSDAELDGATYTMTGQYRLRRN